MSSLDLFTRVHAGLESGGMKGTEVDRGFTALNLSSAKFQIHKVGQEILSTRSNARFSYQQDFKKPGSLCQPDFILDLIKS